MKVNVLQKFTILSAGATLVVAGALGLLVSTVLSRNLLSREAQITAEALRTITNVDLPPDVFARAVREHDAVLFGYLWSHFRQIPEVFRLKIYDSKGTVVWSDEPLLIGKTFADNEELAEALGGEVAVEMGKPKTEHEFERPLAPEQETLELYVPLISQSDRSVYAVVEIYKLPASFLATRRYWLQMIWAGAGGGGLLIFLSLFGLFRGALREQNRLSRIERQYAEIDFEMKAAGAIQRKLLPAGLPTVPGVSMAVFHHPCRDIGGDYYDAFLLSDGTLAIIMADSVGKGIPAALLAAQTQAVLRAQVETASGPASAIAAANRALTARGQSSLFVTVFLARIDPAGRRITYCNAGHCPGLLARRGAIALLDKGGLPLGVEPSAEYEQGEIPLQAGDILLTYTDGVTEAMNVQGEMFGSRRLEETLAKSSAHGEPEKILQAIRDALDGFRDPAQPQDDETMMCLALDGLERKRPESAS